jgi:glycosyltransferase involved in cell wall biosynthesis
MRFAIVTELFYPNLGGQEVRYLELGKELVNLGHSLDVFTIRVSPSHLREEVLAGIAVHRVVDGFGYKEGSLMPRNPWDILRFTLRVLRKEAGLAGFDAVIFNEWPILPAIVAPTFLDKRRVAIDWCEIRGSWFWKIVYWLMTHPEVAHLGVSDAICGALMRSFEVPALQTKTVVSGVNALVYKSRGAEKRDKTIVFLGRLAPHKDPLLAIRAFRRYQLAGKGYCLHIVGDGNLLGSAKEVARGDPGVVIHGCIEDYAKIELLRKSTLLVLPSKREGFPRVVAEAAAAATPTLTTLYPGNGTVSVVRQYGIGWVCDPTEEALGTSMQLYAQMSREWSHVSSLCNDVASKVFDWQQVAVNLIAFLGDRK